MNKNEMTGSEVQEFWLSLQSLGDLSDRERTIRDEMIRTGYKPADIRAAIEEDRADGPVPSDEEIRRRAIGEMPGLEEEHPDVYVDDEKPFVKSKGISWEEMYNQTEKQHGVLFEELRLLRDQVIKLHEVLTNKPFLPEHSSIPTNTILQVLIDGGRKLLDDAEQITKDAQSYAQGSARNSLQLQKKLDTVVGLLAQALMACTKGEAPSGRTEPPSA